MGGGRIGAYVFKYETRTWACITRACRINGSTYKTSTTTGTGNGTSVMVWNHDFGLDRFSGGQVKHPSAKITEYTTPARYTMATTISNDLINHPCFNSEGGCFSVG